MCVYMPCVCVCVCVCKRERERERERERANFITPNSWGLVILNIPLHTPNVCGLFKILYVEYD